MLLLGPLNVKYSCNYVLLKEDLLKRMLLMFFSIMINPVVKFKWY